MHVCMCCDACQVPMRPVRCRGHARRCVHACVSMHSVPVPDEECVKCMCACEKVTSACQPPKSTPTDR